MSRLMSCVVMRTKGNSLQQVPHFMHISLVGCVEIMKLSLYVVKKTSKNCVLLGSKTNGQG
ncbi:hypothetical protein GCM10011501_03730 [Thalassotalea profundi]|uniref:Uncharacterized protein n=1 Tax=Thalassotalea profundi TaxID=2036687 RepID=A0ABQ3IFD6_9GAMM|nr:hypothetical protein GCM10011501_03730 [Thalassotalea profundi]